MTTKNTQRNKSTKEQKDISKRRSTLNGQPLPKSTVNDRRDQRQRAERRSYRIVQAEADQQPQRQQQQQQPDYFSVTCVEVSCNRQESQVVLPTQWKPLPSSLKRHSWHKHFAPGASVLRQRNSTNSDIDGRKRRSNSSFSSSETKSVRFSNDYQHRFYCKGSSAVEQFVELSCGANKDSIQTDPSLMEPLLVLDSLNISQQQQQQPQHRSTVEILQQHIYQAVERERPVQEIVTLFQRISNAFHSTTFTSSIANETWLKTLYHSVKSKLQKTTSTSNQTPRDQNLKQIKILLNIYMQSDTLIQRAFALLHWSRFQITVEAVHNVPILQNKQDTTKNTTTTIAGQVFHSSKATARKLKLMGQLPTKQTIATSTTVDYTQKNASSPTRSDGAHRYFINTNAIWTEEEKTDFHLQLNISSESSTTITKGHVRIPCSFFRYLCTQPENPFALERDLVFTNDMNGQSTATTLTTAPPARVQFSIRKVPLKQGFLDEQHSQLREKLRNIINWIQRFQHDNTSTTVTTTGLSAHICATIPLSFSNFATTLLHAATLLQSPTLVEKLLEMGAQPFQRNQRSQLSTNTHVHSGSALALALSLLDNDEYNNATNNSTSLQNMVAVIHLLQRPQIRSCGISSDDSSTNASFSSQNSSDQSRNSSSYHHSTKKRDIAPKLPRPSVTPQKTPANTEKSDNGSISSSERGSSDSKTSTSSGKENKATNQQPRLKQDPISSWPKTTKKKSRKNKNALLVN